MTPRGRRTGYRHKLVDEKLIPSKVKVEANGSIGIRVQVGPINTSGNFNGLLSLSISEIHHLLGILEEEKFKSLRKEET